MAAHKRTWVVNGVWKDQRTVEERRSYNRRVYVQDYVTKRAYARAHCAEMSVYIQALRSRPCTDCKQSFPWYVMEHDHVRGKRHRCVSGMSSQTKTAIDAEVALCDLVCANCHRKRTHERGQTTRRKPSSIGPVLATHIDNRDWSTDCTAH